MIAGGIAFFFSCYVTLSYYLKKQVRQKLQTYGIEVSSVNIDLIRRSVHVQGLTWVHENDTVKSLRHAIRLNHVDLNGISVYNALIRKTIDIAEIHLDSGEIVYNHALPKMRQENTNPEISRFKFETIKLTNINVKVYSDSILNFEGGTNLNLSEVDISTDPNQPPQYSIGAIHFTGNKIKVNPDQGLYGVSVAQLAYDSEAQELVIDSAQLIPHYEKYEFARKFGRQTDRISVSVPKLHITGIDYQKLCDTTFIARQMEITSFSVQTFRDKRIPFFREGTVPLPMESFIALPVAIKIDSITITNSNIIIEEHPERGNGTLTVPFNNVNATFTALNNRIGSSDNPVAELKASGISLGESKINATFKFPLDGSPSYHATGYISDLPLQSLNPILKTVAEFRIESGQLNSLSFDFSYSDLASKGHVETTYENLSILSLKSKENSINEIKTFLANLIVKEEKSRATKKSKRTGTIDIQRDRKRFIFNVWWKSLFDGLKKSIL